MPGMEVAKSKLTGAYTRSETSERSRRDDTEEMDDADDTEEMDDADDADERENVRNLLLSTTNTWLPTQTNDT